MSKKTKCCKKYKRGGKYCRGCPLLKHGARIKETYSARKTTRFLRASITKASLKAKVSARDCSAS